MSAWTLLQFLLELHTSLDIFSYRVASLLFTGNNNIACFYTSSVRVVPFGLLYHQAHRRCFRVHGMLALGELALRWESQISDGADGEKGRPVRKEMQRFMSCNIRLDKTGIDSSHNFNVPAPLI